MKYASICSGIEAPTVAWHPLGWQPVWFCENAKFPSSVLAHHYPDVQNLGDATKITENEIYSNSTFDVFVGGTPCQGFSTAGKRAGMDDPRSRLAWEYVRIVEQKRPTWILWENVPGVLSSKSSGSRDFEAFVSAISGVGYGVCWRVLNAQYFGVAQRRFRVFLVGYLGDWRPAAAVLFERQSLRRSSPPSQEKRQDTAGNVAPCAGKSGVQEVALTLLARAGRRNAPDENFIAQDKTGVRRLTPIEYERLQGFPDNYTKVPHNRKDASKCPDGPRYAACGNSIAVPVLEWIGRRIQMVDKLKQTIHYE